MNITIIGVGYVGLVTGVCLSNVSNNVICLDVDKDKIDLLNKGCSPIYEPGLESKIKSGLKLKRLKFTSIPKQAIESSDIIFIAVGTPSLDSGKTDLSYIKSAIRTIAENLNNDKIIVIKSTVPVGTTHFLKEMINSYIVENNIDYKIDIISNPEFLKEGKAIKDFESPDRIVLGYDNEDSLEILREIYRPFNFHHDKIITMDIKSAELVKYAANSMLATKISFINEMANICEKTGANINSVRKGVGSDSRIGFDFIYPGLGFGGSCFPKDLKAVYRFAKESGYDTKIINAVIDVNNNQKKFFAEKIIKYLHCNRPDSTLTVAVWGLSFKPETDDIREAPSIDVIEKILDNNIKVQAFDPVAIDNFKNNLNHPNLSFGLNMYDVLKDVDALVLCTEWNEFRSPDFNKVKNLMKGRVVFDGKNIYDSQVLNHFGFEHFQVGVKS